MDFAIIDAIGPFFRGLQQRRINWSKIPFNLLRVAGAGCEEQWAQIRRDLDAFCARVAQLGFNSVTLDDVAHLTDHAWHEPAVRERIAIFREEFRRLFAIVAGHGLRILVTADYLTTSAAIDARLGRRPEARAKWFSGQLGTFLDDFPEVHGIVLRIGESDGHDVVDPLRSRLAVRTPRDVRDMLRVVLPVFEARGRMLIFRTWTVGAYLVGDLIWHRGRLAQAFEGIDSPALIVSMKYGESDFFRYLPLNRHFFRIAAPKIIEFQARREYEGAGEYPAFVGADCERYAEELRQADGVAGISVWCQTGGWHGFRRLAFLEQDAVWIEMNAAIILGVVHRGMSLEGVIESVYGKSKLPWLMELIRRSDAAVEDILYIRQFAQQKLFFRRVRIPPLIHVFWDCIFINDAGRTVMRHFVRDPETAIRDGEAAFANFGPMETLVERLDLPVDDIRFMRDSFEIMLLARRYFFLKGDLELPGRILAAKEAYKARWPRSRRQRYRIRTSFEPFRIQGRMSRWLFALLIRRKRGYRTVLDQLFTLRVLSWIYRLFRVRNEKALPKLVRKSAMGVDVLFK